MKTYKDFILEEDTYKLVETVLLVEEDINEKIDVKAALKKVGLSTEKSGKGLIQILRGASTHIAKAFILALKAHVFKKKDAKEELKQHLKRKVKREEIVDFLLRLDMVSLHIFTGPIHMIDALTGWELMADIHSGAKSASDRVKSAVQALDTAKKDVADFRAKRLDSMVTTLKKMFGIK